MNKGYNAGDTYGIKNSTSEPFQLDDNKPITFKLIVCDGLILHLNTTPPNWFYRQMQQLVFGFKYEII